MRYRIIFGLSALGFAGIVAAQFPAPQATASTAEEAHAARVELGRRLFLDETVSRGGKFSCASCHDPEHGFSDPRKVSEDENGLSVRHSQPVTDLGNGGMHWDGEFQTVHQLLTARLAPGPDAAKLARELANMQFKASKSAAAKTRNGETSDRMPDAGEFARRIQTLAPPSPPYYGPVTPGPTTPSPAITPMLVRLKEDNRYAEGLMAAYDTAEPTTELLVDAMAQYLGSLQTTESPYDRFAAGDWDALDPAAYRGLHVFQGKAGCATCHETTAGKRRARFTDDRYHNTGVAFQAAAITPSTKPPVTGTTAAAAPAPTAPVIDKGRADKNFVPADFAKFKTPSLRDVARRPPYMHDGSFATLAAVVDYYDAGGTPNAHLDASVKPLKLSKQEKADLVSFLEALTGDQRAGLGKLTPLRSDKLTVKLIDQRGRPLRDFEFEVRPSGDRLAGSPDLSDIQHVRTSSRGSVDVMMPASTHVRLVSKTHEIGLTRAIPDWKREVKLMVTPKERIAVTVRFADDLEHIPATLRFIPVDLPNGHSRSAVVFEKVRGTAPQTALYSAKRVGLEGEHVAMLSLDAWAAAKDNRVVFTNVDFDGGLSETLDLRAATRTPRPRLKPSPLESVPAAPTEQASLK